MTSPSQNPTAVSVLVVDDNHEGAQLLYELLDMDGYSAAVAFDGTSALALCDERRWHVMLIDLQMPDMSGAQLARRVREEFQPTPLLVALSGFAETDLSPDDAAQFAHFLRKPVDLEALSALLATVRP